MLRLFTAIEIPDEIKAGLHRLHLPLPGAKWVKPDDYHLTLRFAGSIGSNVAREFAANLAGIETDTFEIRLIGVGAFGNNDPHTVWAGVEPSSALDALARAHERAARNAGLAPDKRGFKPHVTLARLRHATPEPVARYLQRYTAYRSEPFMVIRTVLMSSKPLTGGGPYVVEDSFPMRGAAWAEEDGEAAW
jgi:RNA 2',3'-cyclic 3'-phosphodiesterase